MTNEGEVTGIKGLRQFIVFAAAVLLTSCATSTLTPPVTERPEAPPVATLPQPPVAPPVVTPPPAVVTPAPQPAPPPIVTPAPPPAATPSSALLASVDTALAAGDLERAAALCERALRISPRDPVVWYRLATIRYEQRRYSDAVDTARRALSFAGNNAGLTRAINELLRSANSQLN